MWWESQAAPFQLEFFRGQDVATFWPKFGQAMVTPWPGLAQVLARLRQCFGWYWSGLGPEIARASVGHSFSRIFLLFVLGLASVLVQAQPVLGWGPAGVLRWGSARAQARGTVEAL